MPARHPITALPALLATIAALAVLLVAVPVPPASAADEQAGCADVYKIYQACFDGGRQADLEACGYLVRGLSTQLLGEEGLSGFSAALTIAMCKRGCEDGAGQKAPMPMAAFRREFCGGTLK